MRQELKGHNHIPEFNWKSPDKILRGVFEGKDNKIYADQIFDLGLRLIFKNVHRFVERQMHKF